MTVGTLSFTGHGAMKVAFQGRISRSKKLKPGRYTLVVTATNSAGRRSPPQALSFTIVTRAKGRGCCRGALPSSTITARYPRAQG